MTRLVMAVLLLAAGAVPGAAQDQPAASPQVSATVRAATVTGAKELTEHDCLSAAGVHVGEPLPGTPDEVAARLERHYREAGYTFAHVTARWDPDAGALTLEVDEGVIGGVEFRGIDQSLARRLADDFALKAGDVFNRSRARDALRALLRPARGAIAPRRDAFDLVDTPAGRQLLVNLREPSGRFRLVPDLGDREDWFTPVDGFVPSLGFGAAVFDHTDFNHAFISGHLSFKTGSDQAGYALGVERPFFGARKLFLSGELHDLSATDDEWRVTSFEASLSAAAVRRSYRDYYRRRGVQFTAAYRPESHAELLVAWRVERQEPLATTTDFSVWRGDQEFRPNRPAANGRLQALVFGASIDGRGFDRESLESTYRRHQVENAFGERLPSLEKTPSEWRIDWHTEVSSPGALGSDFDFTRSIVSARYRAALSPHQEFGARAIAGWSSGALPPQRIFAVGGLGSIEGYPFETQVGTGMTLANLEYALGWRDGLRLFGLYDVGRTTASGADTRWLNSVGFGFGIGDGFRIDFAYPVTVIPTSVRVLFRFGRTF